MQTATAFSFMNLTAYMKVEYRLFYITLISITNNLAFYGQL